MRHLPSPLGVSSGRGTDLKVEDIIQEEEQEEETPYLKSGIKSKMIDVQSEHRIVKADGRRSPEIVSLNPT